jgi:hypothetical protein
MARYFRGIARYEVSKKRCRAIFGFVGHAVWQMGMNSLNSHYITSHIHNLVHVYSEDGSNMFLRNVVFHLPNYMVS